MGMVDNGNVNIYEHINHVYVGFHCASPQTVRLRNELFMSRVVQLRLSLMSLLGRFSLYVSRLWSDGCDLGYRVADVVIYLMLGSDISRIGAVRCAAQGVEEDACIFRIIIMLLLTS